MGKIILLSTSLILILVSVVVLFVFFYHKKLLHERLKREKLEAEQNLCLFQAAVKAQEEERARIARDLHDGVGGILNTASLLVKHQEEQLLQSGETISDLSKISCLINEGVGGVREAAHNLMPPSLHLLGLCKTLNALALKINTIGQITLELWIAPQLEENRLPQFTELSVYRMVQELLSNAHKYAPGSKVYLSLIIQGETMEMSYVDDGPGFEFTQGSQGMGLKNFQLRAALLKGQLKIDSAPGAGTRMTVRWTTPLINPLEEYHETTQDQSIHS